MLRTSLKFFDCNLFRLTHKAFVNFTDIECKKHMILHSTKDNIMGLPHDFNIDEYKKFNPDIKHLTDYFIVNHFIHHGEKRIYKIDVPQDFEPSNYVKYNPDLKDLSDDLLRAHYSKHGIQEKRVYKLNNLPIDFNAELYLKYNPDLMFFNERQLEAHYCEHGIKENRIYKLKNLPKDFDYLQYAFFNKELNSYTAFQLEAHYDSAGVFEKRKYKDDLFNKDFFIKKNNITNYIDYSTYTSDITQIKSQKLLELIEEIPNEFSSNCLLLVGHMATLQGATHHLYSLYNYLKEKIKTKIYIIDNFKNEDVLQKYNVIEEDFLSYEQDSTLLYYICKKLDPLKIYFNCFNSQMLDVYYKFDKSKILIHSHEIKQDFVCFDKTITPTFVVSERIKNQYNYNKELTPFIQSPILTQDVLNVIDLENDKFVGTIVNEQGILDFTKITIGMCGGTNERKNYLLFKNLATYYPEYNFLWVGGHLDITENNIFNLFQIKDTPLPYKYFKIFDYFLLTSVVDPCPYVVLENLYLGNSIISFKNNIYTNHKCNQLSDCYFELDDSIGLDTAKLAIETWIKPRPKPIKNCNGKNYIKQFYTNYTESFINKIINE